MARVVFGTDPGEADVALELPLEYVRTVAGLACVWGYPMVNMLNRRAALSRAPEPGRLNGVLPASPVGQIAMLNDYIDPGQRFIACPNQDVVYGLGFFSLDEQPVVVQVPEFGDRFHVYAFYDARTDQFGQVGSPYGSRPGHYLLVGPSWTGEAPDGIVGVFRSSTALANAIPRIFMDDTDEDRAAIQPLVDRVMVYPLTEFTGAMRSKTWAEVPSFDGPSSSGEETKWVRPETFFSELGDVLKTVSPLPGEEALYGQFTALLEAGRHDPAVAQAMTDAAVELDGTLIGSLMRWRHNGVPAGNGWKPLAPQRRLGVGLLQPHRHGALEHVRESGERDAVLLLRHRLRRRCARRRRAVRDPLRRRRAAAGRRLLVADALRPAPLLLRQPAAPVLARNEEHDAQIRRRRLSHALRGWRVAGRRSRVELAPRAGRSVLPLSARVRTAAGDRRRGVDAADRRRPMTPAQPSRCRRSPSWGRATQTRATRTETSISGRRSR